MYQQEQEEYQPIPQPYTAHNTEGSLQFQINVNEIIDEFKSALTGQEITLSPEGHLITNNVSRPLINNEGVNSILTILKSHLTKIFILSDLEEHVIEEMTIAVGQVVIDDIYYNWDRYEIRDNAAATSVLNAVTNTVFATLRKAIRGKYLRFLSTTTSSQEIQHGSIQRQNPNQAQKSSILGTIFSKKR